MDGKEKIRPRQMLKLVTGNYYDELVGSVNDMLNDLESNWKCIDIQYFGMNDNDPGSCAAFMLFETRDTK